jgi:hypothetical protein
MFCYFCFFFLFWFFFWPGQLLVQHLMATLDPKNLDRTLTNSVILKLHSKRLQTVPVILFIFTKFVALSPLLQTQSSWEQHFTKQFLWAVRVTNFQASATECTADSTSDYVREVSWSSPPPIICYSLQNYCFLYLHLNVLMISNSKSCSWWVQLAGKTQPLCFWEMCSLSEQYTDQWQKEFSIFGIHFHVELHKVVSW